MPRQDAHDTRRNISAWIEPEEFEVFSALVERRGISIAEAIREALSDWYRAEARRAPERAYEAAVRAWIAGRGPKPEKPAPRPE